ncbi:MAG: metallophosphoesterase [Acidilobus sp.]
MLVAVVSDSHDDVSSVRLAAFRAKSLGVKMIIHLGDIISPFTLKELGQAGARVEAVFGNNDGEFEMLGEVARSMDGNIGRWPRVISAGGRRLLLMHGHGPAEGTVEIAHALAESGRYDAVLYGHTHQAELTYVKGVLILNPGPLASFLGGPTMALVDTDTMDAKLVRLS